MNNFRFLQKEPKVPKDTVELAETRSFYFVERQSLTTFYIH